MDNLKTSDEWQRLDMSVIVHDPDGWDKMRFQFSWYEERITETEYLLRRNKSTCRYTKKRGRGKGG